jgi:hypothetical protein
MRPEDPWERIRGGEITLMIIFPVIGLIATVNGAADQDLCPDSAWTLPRRNCLASDQRISDTAGTR